ncbi:hypothetical protein SFRURICE_015819 [Spodoptera frugiperda]|uniref:SFRICE_017878 n=1 Tax=Spodoptera frugiperda TaxID=7108 RepID=A0A2H1W241_SPOFR|nr:hypothetical protein SFRURICE_015819 [Spodoptera frugiperda]
MYANYLRLKFNNIFLKRVVRLRSGSRTCFVCVSIACLILNSVFPAVASVPYSGSVCLSHNFMTYTEMFRFDSLSSRDLTWLQKACRMCYVSTYVRDRNCGSVFEYVMVHHMATAVPLHPRHFIKTLTSFKEHVKLYVSWLPFKQSCTL